MSGAEEQKASFRIYRAADAPDLMEAGCMTVEPFDMSGLGEMAQSPEAGGSRGEDIKVLTDLPGFGLTHVWFKAGYQLPLHSHDADCMYFIVSGSLRLGTEELGPRDCFFVPADVPYTYKPGPEGVEVLEIRHSNAFNFVNHAKNPAWWAKAAAEVAAHKDGWENARRPVLNG